MRTIAVLTATRADYGICRPVLRAIDAAADLELRLLVGDTHLAPACGSTIEEIRADGFECAEVVRTLPEGDSPEAIAAAIGRAAESCARAYARCRPDLLVLTGDRFETLAAAAAAAPFLIPVMHLHGGEISEGAMDDAFRHAIVKLSHLHAVSTAGHGRRVMQLGEEAWRITVAGAPALDNLRSLEWPAPAAVLESLGLPLAPAPLLVTYHPETLAFEESGAQIGELLAALQGAQRPIVFTAPNTDTASGTVRAAIDRFVRARADARLVSSLGTRRYFSLMSGAAAMLGNSSSGIIEAASFGLPVVNVGSRQRGRTRGRNVIDVAHERGAIGEGLRRALDPAFRAGLAGMANPYGDGHAAGRIVERLRTVPLGAFLTTKRFVDLSAGPCPPPGPGEAAEGR
jgi:UDP-hydrolysing UDP-N-acetyl-D-glucosamine 2-epimerase